MTMDDYGNEIIEPQTEMGRKLADRTTLLLETTEALRTALSHLVLMRSIVDVWKDDKVLGDSINSLEATLNKVDKHRKNHKL